MDEMIFKPSRYVDVPHIDLLSWTFGNPEYDLNKPLFINAYNESESISYHQAKCSVRKLIAGFRALGLKAGDSVCLHSFNNVNYSLIYLAVVGFGGRFVGSNPSWTSSELIHLFTLSEVKCVLTEPGFLSSVLPATKEVGISSPNVFIFSSSTEDQSSSSDLKLWTSLLDHGEEDWISFNDEKQAKATTVALMSTSGTTGMPKAAEISHYAQIAQSIMLYDSKEKPYQVIRLLCLPQFHAFNAPIAHIAPLREGHTTYVMKRYQPAKYTEFISRYKISETTMVNPIIFNLLALPESERAALDSLRFVWCGGVALDAVVQNKLSGILNPDAIVAQVYGMTEIGWIVTMHFPEKDDTGSVGRLLPSMEAKIMDPLTNLPITTHSIPGEIYLRGPSLMTSYISNPHATKETIIDGWLASGDIGYVSPEGKWYVTDRKKELIKVRGWQVSPTELEACLLGHPMVKDVAVVGVDEGDERGEVPRAYVVLEGGEEWIMMDDKGDLNEKGGTRFNGINGNTEMQEDIKLYLKGRLATYKVLAGGVKFVSRIPRSAAGKTLRKVLKDGQKAENGIGALQGAVYSNGHAGK
ncbi:uncharacterized protein BP5553_07918 [Venustampulla echinocandica]|uniref:Acetyl-CoA synthetase-like protein n=1 Tax=Venustampulla echinocandica TaxID=2656787 RepID=A0A370THX5_9HELO|nr:uncharacterized protein BP5553_07918 [Venustampulla echinocandica]RDL34790.1 hypothetical protein BP5553_07918 [Venustampulla echinocandica]